MTYQFFVKGKLKSLNDYILAERTNRFMGAKMKKQQEGTIMKAFRKKYPNLKIEKPIRLHYDWIEANMARDHDNVAFAQKFVQDALVKCGAIADDNWKGVIGFTHSFQVDKNHTGVRVLIEEVDNYDMSLDIGEQTAKKMRELRKKMGYSQDKLSELSGIPKRSLSRFETGARRPSFDSARRIAMALEVPVGYLLGVREEDAE